MGYALVLLGSVAAVIGYIWFVIVAFKDGGVLWGLGCLMCGPVFQIIYLIQHWEDAQSPFLLWAAGMLASFGGSQMIGG